MSVHVLATLDTKGSEAEWVRRELQAAGVAVTLVDTGCLGQSLVSPDVSRSEIFAAADQDWATIAARGDRGEAVKHAACGAAHWISRRHQQGLVTGILGLGGSAGTTIATAAMRELPVGLPKLMVSTLASGDVAAFVGASDILMLHSVVDIAGINRISRAILGEAVGAMAGMVARRGEDAAAQSPDGACKPLVAATMFGVTTPCVEAARRVLEDAGYEVLVFHATGSGGRAMEALVRDGWVEGVLDITTTELADFQVGGVMSAGPDRLTAAGRRGVPQVVSVGATDMVNFWAPDSVPPHFRNRCLHAHNPHVTLMRTTADECRRIGEELAGKVRVATGPARVLLPQRGVSALDAPGQPFDDPEARQVLLDTIEQGLPAGQVERVDMHLNDPRFGALAARTLLELMRASKPDGI